MNISTVESISTAMRFFPPSLCQLSITVCRLLVCHCIKILVALFFLLQSFPKCVEACKIIIPIALQKTFLVCSL